MANQKSALVCSLPLDRLRYQPATMTLRTPPRPVLASARVVAYAYVDDVPYEKGGALYAEDTLIEAVPHLASAINLGKDADTLLFHCDSEWEVRGTSGTPTIDEAKLRAERDYPGVAKRWVDFNTTVDEVLRYHDETSGAVRCSFAVSVRSRSPASSQEKAWRFAAAA